MSDVRLVTVHAGSLWEVELLAGLLQDEGIRTFLPDHLTKRVDPFITGGNALVARLQVPAEDAERAAAVLAAAKTDLADAAAEEASFGDEGEEHEEGADRGEDDDEEDEDDAEAMTPDEELRYLASRTRWWALVSCALAFLTLPFALIYFGFYLQACRAHGKKAPGHAFTIAVVAVTVAGALAMLGGILYFLGVLGPVFGSSAG